MAVKKLDRLGEIRTMLNGMPAKITRYSSNKDLDIEFEDGYVAYKKEYKQFALGKIRNPFVTNNLYTLMSDHLVVTNKNQNVKFLIDLEDFEKCKPFTWFVAYTGRHGDRPYVYRHKDRSTERLHRFLLNPESHVHVDHINGDGLDNRKSNLRFCSNTQNSMNTTISRNNNSGYKGVSFRKDVGKWRAYIGVNRESIHLGYFENVYDAARAYNKAALEYFKEFAKLNEIVES